MALRKIQHLRIRYDKNGVSLRTYNVGLQKVRVRIDVERGLYDIIDTKTNMIVISGRSKSPTVLKRKARRKLYALMEQVRPKEKRNVVREKKEETADLQQSQENS